MRETVGKISLLNSLGREITSNLKLDRFVQKALQGIARILKLDLALLYLRKDNALTLQGVYPPETRFEKVGTSVEAVGECLCGLAGGGETIYSSDIHTGPKCVLNECKNAGVKSFAALPLMIEGKVLGVLSLATLTQRDFKEQRDFLEAVSTQIAVALQNSLLYETMAKQVEELERAIALRNRIDAKLQDSEKSLQKQLVELEYIYNKSPLGLCFVDTGLRYVRINAEMATINGRSISEHIGRTMSEVIPEMADRIEPLYRKVIETGEPIIDIEVRGMRNADPGKPRDWLANYYPVKDDIGRLLGVGAIVQDITDRKEAERELKRSEERYQIVSGLTSDYAYAYRVQPDGSLINDWVTGAFERISGYSRKEIRERGGWETLIYPDDLHIPMAQFEALFRNEATEVEYRIVSKAGEIRWMRDYARPVMDEEQKNLQYIFGAVQDISERKEAEAENTRLQDQLQQSQKMEAIGTLAGGIAHDFNNILSAVIGYTEMAMVEAKEGTPLHQNLTEVFRAGGRAKDLVKQILTFSRQNKKETQPVQMKLIAKEVVKFMRASLPATIKIQQDIRSDSLIMADPTQVYQIVLNLCTNAGYAMAENGGLLEVKLADLFVANDASASYPDLTPGPYLRLIVRDTGHGIPEPILKRIFDPFFTTKDKEKGTGMGLSVVHGIVGSYGGTISVTSEPEKGSTFTVFLPRLQQTEEVITQAQAQIETGSEHILLVDDEEALVNIGKKILESLGYQVTTRTSSLEALELFKARKKAFDLVITDTTMPNMAGDKLAQEMIRLKPGIPVILCSGYSSRIDQQQAFALGIRAFVTKPILRSEIARAVRNVLDQSKKG